MKTRIIIPKCKMSKCHRNTIYTCDKQVESSKPLSGRQVKVVPVDGVTYYLVMQTVPT